ncbi:phage tail assembly chaperone G [Staphylococcus capitis subsp. urealyticus]
MIKFEIKDTKTGKTESYKKDFVTMGEAEKFWDFMAKVEKENEKSNPDTKKVRGMERQLVVDFFADQGLTEESILENMSTKTYSKVVNDLFREVQGEDESDSEDASEEVGKTE